MKPTQSKIGEHFRKMKSKVKKHSEGMHVIHLPPEVYEIYIQIHKPRHGGRNLALRCPYCRVLNIEGQQMCCDKFRDALIMIRDTAAVPVMVN